MSVAWCATWAPKWRSRNRCCCAVWGPQSSKSLFVQSLLRGLPHNYSDRLTRLVAMGAPGNVRRAEEYLRANAEEAVTIESVAQAAGCSARALQLAFRRYRGITPMDALRRVRLERARAETLRTDGSQSVIDIAMKFGFSHAKVVGTAGEVERIGLEAGINSAWIARGLADVKLPVIVIDATLAAAALKIGFATRPTRTPHQGRCHP